MSLVFKYCYKAIAIPAPEPSLNNPSSRRPQGLSEVQVDASSCHSSPSLSQVLGLGWPGKFSCPTDAPWRTHFSTLKFSPTASPQLVTSRGLRSLPTRLPAAKVVAPRLATSASAHSRNWTLLGLRSGLHFLLQEAWVRARSLRAAGQWGPVRCSLPRDQGRLRGPWLQPRRRLVGASARLP